MTEALLTLCLCALVALFYEVRRTRRKLRRLGECHDSLVDSHKALSHCHNNLVDTLAARHAHTPQQKLPN